jgi:hypothetical protein
MQSLSDCVYLCQSVSLSPQSVPSIFLTLTPKIPNLFTVILQRIIIGPIHCIGYTALLKTFTVTSGEVHRHAVMIHTDQIILLYFLVYKLT